MNTSTILSSNKKKERNIQILLDTFHAQKSLTISNIQNCLKCNRQSAYHYINYLKDRGYIVTSMKKGRTQYYSLDFSCSPYLPMTFEILRNYCIIQALQDGPVKQNELLSKFLVSKNPGSSGHSKIPLDIGLTSYYKYLQKLIASEEIIDDKISNKYYLSGKTIPLQWSLNEDIIFDIYNEISNIPSGSPYYNQFLSLKHKLDILTGDADQIDTHDNYLLYGKSHNSFKNIANRLSFLGKYNYQNKVLNVQYTTQTSKSVQITFALGIIVYCLEKDSIYLIGERSAFKNSNSSKKYTIINLESITGIKETTTESLIFNSDEYIDIFETMFSISVEPPVPVTVEFQIFGNIEKKIRILHKQRPKSKIIVNQEEKKIIYSDIVRGLSDFAAYLRQFGRSALVISPPELKEKILFSVNRSLERYMED